MNAVTGILGGQINLAVTIFNSAHSLSANMTKKALVKQAETKFQVLDSQ
jgi:hypothetical protein